MDKLVNNIIKEKKSILFIFLIQILLSTNLINCGNCKDKENLTDTKCFNDLITFTHDSWRSGHASNNKHGNLIVEFSVNYNNSIRLFYGLKKNGRYYFPGEPVYKEINLTCSNCDDENYRGRYEVRNLLIYLKNDTEREKEYLFVMSSYQSLVELIDVDDRENLTNYSWEVRKFFNLTRTIFSLEYTLFELDNTNTFIAAFIESAGFNNENKEKSDSVTILKFQINSFGLDNPYTIIKSVTLSNTYDGRVVSAFRLEDSNLIALLFIDAVGAGGKYVIKFYEPDLTYKEEVTIWKDVYNLWTGFGIFVKGISLIGDYAAFAMFTNGGDNDDSRKTLKFRYVKYNSGSTEKFDYLKDIDFTNTPFRQDVDANAFYKLSDNRVVLFTSEDYNSILYARLHMFLFYFYKNYTSFKVREFKFFYPERRFCKEVAASIFNGYLLFTGTIGDSKLENLFASMMIFGFGNGTDHEIDISPYLMDTGYYSSENNLFDYLMSTMVIDNNIFGFEKEEKIRFISICDELLLYKGKMNETQEEITIKENELFDSNITLLQNRQITKIEGKLYTLVYQFMVKETNYTEFDSITSTFATYPDGFHQRY